MDPLSVAVSAGSLAAVVIGLSMKAAHCIEEVQGSDQTFRNFSAELDQLATTLTSLEAALRNKGLKDALGKATTLEEAQKNLTTLREIIRECEMSLKEAGALLESVRGGSTRTNFLQKSSMAWKFNAKAPQLSRIQTLLSGYQAALQIHLQLINLLMTTSTSVGLQNVDSTLEEIKTEILRLRFRLSTISTDPDSETTAVNSIKQSISTSEYVLSCTSEYLGSTAGTVRNISPVNFDADRAATVEDWIEVRYDEEISEVLSESDDYSDAEVIAEIEILANKYFNEGDYVKAKRFYHTFLKRSSVLKSTRNKNEIIDADLKLARCDMIDERYQDSLASLKSIDLADCSAEQNAQVQQCKAEIFLLSSDFDQAKRYAKQAMKRQERGTPAYSITMSLLFRICTGQGETEEAEVYQSRIPEHKESRIIDFKIQSHDTSRDGASCTENETTSPELSPIKDELPSERINEPTNITFVNRTKSTRISVYWLDFNMKAKHYVDISAGQSNLRPTYVGHRWRVNNWETGEVIAVYDARDFDAQAIISDEMKLKPMPKESRSEGSSKATAITCVNSTKDAVSALWIDWHGRPHHYVTIGPGKTICQPTYIGHVWRFIYTESGQMIASFLARAGKATIVLTDDMHSLTKPLHLSTTTGEEGVHLAET